MSTTGRKLEVRVIGGRKHVLCGCHTLPSFRIIVFDGGATVECNGCGQRYPLEHVAMVATQSRRVEE